MARVPGRGLTCDMPPWRALAATTAAAGIVLVAAPAQAQHLSVADAAGDSVGAGLDITDVTFRNRDHSVVSELSFTRDRRGTLVVKVKARHGSALAIVSRHPRRGPGKTFLVDKSGRVPCGGLTSDWNRNAATALLRMPARCLDEGNYGAVRNWALTERLRSGGDVDYAPEQTDGELTVTDWIPRG